MIIMGLLPLLLATGNAVPPSIWRVGKRVAASHPR